MHILLNIINIETNVFSEKVERLSISGFMGNLEILPGHAPLLTMIKPGQIYIVTKDKIQISYYISSGFLEVLPKCVTILADTIIRAEYLDEIAAINARENAKQILSLKKSDNEIANAIIQIKQATEQLRTIKLLKNKRKNFI